MSTEAALNLFQSVAEAAALPDERCQTPPSPTVDTANNTSQTVFDDQLLEDVGTGSKEALGVLFRRHGRVVFNVAWRILRDESEADDLRQEVFLYVFEHAKHYDRRKSTAVSWIIQVTYHRAIDRRRYLTFRQHYKLEALDDQTLCPPVKEISTDRLDGKAILERLKGQLSPEQLQTLELHFFGGYSFREIAEQSNQEIGNVRHHYYRALERLRSNLFPQKRP